MIRFRKRLLFTLITLIITVLIGLGLVLGQLFKEYYRQAFDERLNKEVSLVATYFTDHQNLEKIDAEKLNHLSKTLDSRITVTRTDGRIIYDSGESHFITHKHNQEIINGLLSGKYKKADDFDIGEKRKVHYYWKELSHNDQMDGYVFVSTTLTEIKNAYKQIWWILTSSLSFALVFIMMLGLQITRRYTKPIEEAANVAMELANGNYLARVPEDQSKETGQLSNSINDLAKNLEEMVQVHDIQRDRLATLIENIGSGLLLIDSRGYIILINRAFKEIFHVRTTDYLYKLYYEVIDQDEVIKLIEDIFRTEQKVKKQLLLPLSIERRHFEIYGVPIISTNDVWKGILLVFHDITELKKLEQMRKDFVANVSHELKTPITSIKGFSETLIDGAMFDQKMMTAFLNIILKESDRLQTLIEDLLDLSKIEQPEFTLNYQKTNMVSLLREVIEMLKGKANKKNIEIEFKVPNEDMVVEIDNYRMKQVFINLITNAISYTQEGGKVCIAIASDDEKIFVMVQDTGVGIEKKEIPRIFERFYRVDKARSRESGGTGLGLAIVKHIVEAHRGHITVDSKVGEGTTFTIELNKTKPKN